MKIEIINSIDWNFPVGKYKGKNLKEIASIDNNYCRWFIKNTKNYKFENQVWYDAISLNNSIDNEGTTSLQTDCERIEAYF